MTQEEDYNFKQNLYILEEDVEKIMSIIHIGMPKMTEVEVRFFFHLLGKRISDRFNEYLKLVNGMNPAPTSAPNSSTIE